MGARTGRIGLALAALLASLGVLAGALSFAGGATGGSDERLLPDLVTLPLESSSQLSVTRRDGRTRLLLDNTVGNQGEGPLQISSSENDGVSGCEDGDYVALQDVYSDSDGSPVANKFGCMRYHPKAGHEHWHVFNFTQYELRAWDEPSKTVAQVRKQGFCLFDNGRFMDGPGVPPAPFYSPGDCGFRDPRAPAILEGMSVGWSDLYGQGLPGQAINITGVPAGRYCLRSRVDPLGRIQETDETNNALRTPVRIAPWRGVVKILDGSCPTA